MQIHVVRQGETLWQIAQRYGASLSQVILANQLAEPNILVPGQALVIPNPVREYVVEKGDTLAAIAARYGVTVQELAAANTIANPNNIFVGEFLIIPYLSYTVQSGDTLGRISSRFDVSVQQIIEANGLTANAVLQPGQIIRIPYKSRPTKEVMGFITDMSERGKSTILQIGSSLTYTLPFSYNMRENGTLIELRDGPVLEAAFAQNAAPLLVVTNFRNGKFDSDLTATILRNLELQETLITNLLAKIKEKGYRGVNFDFEYVYPQDRENYNNFLRLVVARLHPEGLVVSTCLAPKVRADQEGLLYEAHDYKAHGEIVDFVILMTYEWGWAGGQPLAISPVNSMRQVIDFAVSVIPRKKIVIGVSLYGRDWKIPWKSGTYASTISPQEAVRRAVRYQVPIQYNKTYEAPFFNYTDQTGQKHEVWFEDARSVQAKYDLVKQYSLRGVSYWELTYSFPQNWAVVKSNFVTRKV